MEGALMFTIETEFDYSAIITLDEEDNFEDVEVILDSEVVYIAQALPDSDSRQIIELSYQQFMDIVVALDLPDGAYYAEAKRVESI
tara:strand:- start:3663 stop:3920 length:258 start_codon:yes stop_codon:yes gene_type:complete